VKIVRFVPFFFLLFLLNATAGTVGRRSKVRIDFRGRRREYPALRYGSRRTVLETDDQYAFVGADLNDRVAVIFNRAHSLAKIDINVSPEMADGDYVDALNGSLVAVKNGRIDMELPAETAAFVTKPQKVAERR
jgi:hypothetical protein